MTDHTRSKSLDALIPKSGLASHLSPPIPFFSTTGRRRSQAGVGHATAPPRLHLHRALHPPTPPYTTIHPLHHHLAPLHHPSAPPLPTITSSLSLSRTAAPFLFFPILL
ncbi:hypothetical protein VPH35_073053 [Triticum aestivum]